LKRNLGTARADLGEVSQALHSERTTAQQQISSLSDEKSAIEREAVAFSRKASSLESDNWQMGNEISHQTSAINSLQSETRGWNPATAACAARTVAFSAR